MEYIYWNISIGIYILVRKKIKMIFKMMVCHFLDSTAMTSPTSKVSDKKPHYGSYSDDCSPQSDPCSMSKIPNIDTYDPNDYESLFIQKALSKLLNSKMGKYDDMPMYYTKLENGQMYVTGSELNHQAKP